MKFIWLNHPRTQEPDTMLTLATYATLAAIAKFALNGVTFTFFGQLFNLGTVDAALIAAILAPTLGAYVARKMKDSPDSE